MDIAADYDVDLFVTPEEATHWMDAKVRRWEKARNHASSGIGFWRTSHRSSQTAFGDQVLGLTGDPGLGKTWFLRHLAEGDSHLSPAAVYLDLRKRNEFAIPEDFVAGVRHQIEEKCGTAAAILLVDSVPSALDAHLSALETDILRPHVMERGSLVIMAWVYPARTCWRSPALRASERYLLRPFDESATRRQVLQLHKAGVLRKGRGTPGIYGYSEGHPLLNYLLATREKVRAFESFLQYWFLRIPSDERMDVWNCLQAVCLLDVLDSAAIQKVLEAYNGQRSGNHGRLASASKVLGTLQRHWMLRPLLDSPGRMVLVGSVRRATKETLKARDAGLCATLDAAAKVSRGQSDAVQRLGKGNSHPPEQAPQVSPEDKVPYPATGYARRHLGHSLT